MLHRHAGSCSLALLILLGAARTSAQSAKLVGTVIDSVHRAPLRHATVVATPMEPGRDSVFHSTLTDAKGQFTLDALPSGRYSVSVEHAFTDSIGLDVPSREVTIPGEGTARTTLALPSVRTLRRTLCPIALADTTLGVMLGVVHAANGSPAAGGRVVLGWSDLSTDKTTLTVRRDERTASTATDSVGVYRACGVPVGVALLVQAQLGSMQSGVITEQIGEAGVLVRDFSLGTEEESRTRHGVASDSATRGSVGNGMLTGSVVGMRGERVASARVGLAGTTRSTTVDSLGRFRFVGLPTGTQGFEVLALGYLPRRFRADVTSDTRVGVVRLDRLAILLDSVRVIARRQYDARLYPEFEARLRRRAFGQFVTEEMIEKRRPFVLSDMMRMMHGFSVRVTPSGAPIFESNRGITTLQNVTNPRAQQGAAPGGSDKNVGRSCVRLYVNGVLDQSGDVNRMVPDAVHGVEVYSVAEAPAKYQGGSCGVVLIWTK
jgi:hypothetical protein